jgi:quinol monooxygenase YgiN
MPTFRELDQHVTYRAQLGTSGGPIVLANVLSIEPARLDELVAIWAEDAAFMRRQPGFVSTQLHRGVGGSGSLLNLAVWESADHLRQAFTTEEFQRHLANYPDSVTVSPHVFEKLAVPGICIA